MNRYIHSICVAFLVTLLVACSNVALEGGFQPSGIPLKISINSWGEINLTVEQEVKIPTPLGTASIGVIVDPAGRYNVESTLTIRVNDEDHFYDLHGEDFNIVFEAGYYKQISLTKRGADLLLVAESSNSVAQDSSGSSPNRENSSIWADSFCPGALDSQLQIGDRAEVIIYQLSARSAPGLSAPREHLLADGRFVEILGGPRCADSAWWWWIHFSGEISTGDKISFESWMMEADFDTYYLRKIP